MATLDLIIISPRNPIHQRAPAGLGYVGEIFDEARLKDKLTQAQTPDAWLAKSLGRLARRFRRRLRVRWVDPWSLPGLFLALRYRVRTFPSVVIGNQIVYTGSDAADFEALVTRELEAPLE